MGTQFEHNFIPLPENEFAVAAVERLFAETPAIDPPLLFLFGPSGAGKSHLVMQALEAFHHRYEGVRQRTLSAYEFATLNMESAAGEEETAAQLEELADLDVFVCEGVQHFDRQTWLQKKLILLIDDILRSGGRVILTSQLPVGAYEQTHPKLVSRFHSGVTASMAMPGVESRKRLIQYFAAIHDLEIHPTAVEQLARKMPVSPREMHGAIVQLEAVQRLEEREIDNGTVEELLAFQQPRNVPSMTDVARSVAKEFGVTVRSIRSPARAQTLLIPRQVAMLLSRELIQANYSDIGAYYGGRSHSTVMHACQALTRKSSGSPELDYRVCQLRRVLQGQPIKPR
ncbi:MAG: hypothetical protein CMJ47_14510 [Planctomyces sp.]|nr:hypothetical protein [Planctomyces sp.]